MTTPTETTETTPTRLEQLFADISAANRLTNFAIAYRGERYGDEYRFMVTAHFSDAAAGQIPCVMEDGATIDAAITATLREVESKRRIIPTAAIYGDEPLIVEVA